MQDMWRAYPIEVKVILYYLPDKVGTYLGYLGRCLDECLLEPNSYVGTIPTHYVSKLPSSGNVLTCLGLYPLPPTRGTLVLPY